MDKFSRYFMDVAIRTAELSYARRLQVGIIAVRDRRIIACGYNGTPEGEDNNCEDEVYSDGVLTLVTKLSVNHAEVNMINFVKKFSITLAGTDIYITHSPCICCAEALVQQGIIKVTYLIDYRCNLGVEYLRKENIEVIPYAQRT